MHTSWKIVLDWHFVLTIVVSNAMLFMFLQNAGYNCFDHENVPEQGTLLIKICLIVFHIHACGFCSSGDADGCF